MTAETSGLEIVIGDAVVIVDHSTTILRHDHHEFTFRIRRLGKTTAYRVEVPSHEITDLDGTYHPERLASYLLRHAKRKFKLHDCD